MNRKVPTRIAAVIAAGIGVLLIAVAPGVSQELRAVGEARAKVPATGEASTKVVSRLRRLIADYRELVSARGAAATLEASSRFSTEALRLDQAGRVQVYVTVGDTGDAVLAALRGHGLDVEIVNKDFGIVQGWAPVDTLDALAAEAAVLKIRPPSYTRTDKVPVTDTTPVTDKGPVTSEGDAIHRCDQARASGFTGAGVKVGVVSDGVDGLGVSQAAGELGPVQVVLGGSGDEGTALLEIVADCASDASLMFAGAGATSLNFVQAVNSLRAAGAQIIVDDISAFLDEPYFEDSTTALNDRSVGASTLRVSSAGNRGLAHYQAMFNPGSFDASPQVMGTRHNFGGGDEFLHFHFPAAPAPIGSTVTIYLQWSNRFGSAGDDYDLCIRQNGQLIPNGCSNDLQNGNDDPLEIVSLTCFGAPNQFCAEDIQVSRFSGASQIIEIYCTLPCVFDEFNNRNDSVVGHKAVPEVLAAAASPATQPTTVEAYSSAGPSTIIFPSTDIRPKPDLDAVDCVKTSRPSFNPFCGTSAAAPQVAGIAAILMQAMGPSATVQGVTAALKATAIDIGLPGFDFDFGFGRADALNAVQSVYPLASAVLPTSRSVLVNTLATAFATVIALGQSPATGCGITPITSIPATFQFQTADPSNHPTGTLNTRVDIPAGVAQNFIFGFTPISPIPPTDVLLSFNCTGAAAPVVSGLNTFLFTASATPVPDILALSATANNDGIVNVPGIGLLGAFAVATANVGAQGSITVTADTGNTALPVSFSLCQTNPSTGACMGTPTPSVTITIKAGDTPTFSIFVFAFGPVPFNAALNRAFVRFKDDTAVTRGATSVAVRTP